MEVRIARRIATLILCMATAPVTAEGARLFAAGLSDSPAVGAVGLHHYVQLANDMLAIYDKSRGLMLAPPLSMQALFDAAPQAACKAPTPNTSALLHDHFAGRWIVAHQSPSHLCIAVSATADATGRWHQHALPAVAAGRTHLALGSDALYVSLEVGANIQRICGIGRAALIAGTEAKLRCRTVTGPYGTVIPASVQPHASVPDGTPGLFFALEVSDAGRGARMAMWRYSWTRDTLSDLVDLPVAPFTVACAGRTGGACIAQPRGGALLPAHAGQLAPSIAFSNDAVVLNHTVAMPEGTAGVRWYELREPFGAVRVHQQETFAPDTTHRWMGVIGMDKDGNVALGYAVSASDTAAGMRYTARLRSDAPGRMQSEQFIADGQGVQEGQARIPYPAGSMALDPADGCTFWFTHQHAGPSSEHAWRTRVAQFKLAGSHCK